MLKKMLGFLAVTAMVTMVAPTPAQAAHVSGSAVFAGDAQVGPDGLCLPGLDPTTGCAAPITGPVPDQDFTFNVPGSGAASECVASGTFLGDVAVGDQCLFDAEGYVTGVVGNTTGPTCGNSHGLGKVDFLVIINGVSLTFLGTVHWASSAGGTLPLTGTFDGHQLVGLVQARPLTPGACVTAPATTFTVAGTVEVAPV